MARANGGLMPDISRLRAHNFYVVIEWWILLPEEAFEPRR